MRTIQSNWAPNKTLKRDFRSRALLTNCTKYEADDSDTFTLAGEDMVDETITVPPKRRREERPYIDTRKGKRNGWDENVETFAN